ncbi:MAG: hypothetical protein GY797_40745 [Deltaproteobacteria bacterium]|nr:hypothetical protein [Deltaproteobacteria bacterium]
MEVFQRFRPSHKSIAVVILIIMISGTLLLLTWFTQRWQEYKSAESTATAQMWSTKIAVAQATSAAEVHRTVTVQAKNTAIAQATINTLSTGYAQASSTAQQKVTQTVQAQATSTSIAQETAITAKRFTAVAGAETKTASKVRKTVTAQIQATLVQGVYQTATAEKVTATAQAIEQIKATATARWKHTATTQAWSTEVAKAKEKTTFQIGATVTAVAHETVTVQAQQGTWLVVEIEKVTVMADKTDGFDNDIEFIMYMVASDGRSSVGISYPPEGEYIDVVAGKPIFLDRYALAMNEPQLGDELGIYITAFDIDDQSLEEAIPYALLEFALQQSFFHLVNKFPRILDIRLPGTDNLEEWMNEYFNLIGEGVLVLQRSQDWQAGKVIKHTTKGYGLEIEYHIHLINKLPRDIEIFPE